MSICGREIIINNIANIIESFNDSGKLNVLPPSKKRKRNSPVRKTISVSPKKKTKTIPDVEVITPNKQPATKSQVPKSKVFDFILL